MGSHSFTVAKQRGYAARCPLHAHWRGTGAVVEACLFFFDMGHERNVLCEKNET